MKDPENILKGIISKQLDQQAQLMAEYFLDDCSKVTQVEYQLD